MGYCYGVMGVGVGVVGVGLILLLCMICVICCFFIFMVLSCLLIVGLSGVLVCMLLLVVSWRLLFLFIGSDGQFQVCRIFSGMLWLLKFRLIWCCGSWDIVVVVCKMLCLVKVLSLVILIVEVVVFSLSDGWCMLIWLKVVVVVFSVVLLFYIFQLLFFISCSLLLQLLRVVICYGKVGFILMIRLWLVLNFFSVRFCSQVGSGVIYSCFQFVGSVYFSLVKVVLLSIRVFLVCSQLLEVCIMLFFQCEENWCSVMFWGENLVLRIGLKRCSELQINLLVFIDSVLFLFCQLLWLRVRLCRFRLRLVIVQFGFCRWVLVMFRWLICREGIVVNGVKNLVSEVGFCS